MALTGWEPGTEGRAETWLVFIFSWNKRGRRNGLSSQVGGDLPCPSNEMKAGPCVTWGGRWEFRNNNLLIFTPGFHSRLTGTRTCTHAFTHTHTCMHACTHAQTHIHAFQTCTQKATQINVHVIQHARQARTHIYTNRHTCTYWHTRSHRHTCILTFTLTQTHTQAYMKTLVYTQTHTHFPVSQGLVTALNDWFLERRQRTLGRDVCMAKVALG